MLSVRLIAHASVLVEADGLRMLTDPWFEGSCFNKSWRMIAPAAPIDLDAVDFMWISHEHPDHFHLPTLKALPDSFKQRVTVLFQQSSDHPKMVAALNGLGFPKVRLLPHRQWVSFRGVELLCYQSRQIDSALAIKGSTGTLLNVNDCDLGPADCRELREIAGEPDILLSQFSIAGFDGVEDKVAGVAERILDEMVAAHRMLGAKTTVPFASFAYFCCDDNRFLNAYANRPRRVAERFAREGLSLTVLMPGESCRAGAAHDSAPALTAYDALFDGIADLPSVARERVPLAAIETAFLKMRGRLKRRHGVWLRLLRPLVVEVPDLATRLEIGLAGGIFRATTKAADVGIASQPLHFMLCNDFGMQTLGVSGRYRLLGGGRNWIGHRILFAMLNAGIGLSLRHLLSIGQLRFFLARRHDLLRQIRLGLSKT